MARCCAKGEETTTPYLTAADYVFLLDPWWNPAVEAQAIDRTHRIGQSSSVFAYRLVCRDTEDLRMLLG